MKESNPTTAIIGLGKTGLSVAKYLKNKNLDFAVYDTKKDLKITDYICQFIDRKNIFLGEFDKNIIKKHNNFIISPGIDLHKDFLAEIIKKNKKISSDIDLFNAENTSKIIAITGSNGKTTVTSIVEHILLKMGIKAKAGGNIGYPALELLNNKYEYSILELSSFQLELIDKINCSASAITNITPDHLDRHATFENYIKIKHKIFENTEHVILNREDENINSKILNYEYSFGGNKPKDKKEFGISYKNGKKYISHGNEKLLCEDEIQLIGTHNMINVCTSLCILFSLGFDSKLTSRHVGSFHPIEHRMENFYNNGQIRWINDSKATNIDSTISAINSLEENIILILGGKSKQDNYEKLNDVISNKIYEIIIYGESKDLLGNAIDNKNKVVKVVNIEHAVSLAKETAKKIVKNRNSVINILLSPACSSYDMFSSYEERGAYFKKCVLG